MKYFWFGMVMSTLKAQILTGDTVLFALCDPSNFVTLTASKSDWATLTDCWRENADNLSAVVISSDEI